jgi:hypothetical protein
MTDEPKLLPGGQTLIGSLMNENRAMKEMLTKVAKVCGDITAERDALRSQLEAIPDKDALISLLNQRDRYMAQIVALFSHAGLWRIATMLESCARVSPYGDVEIRTEEVHDALAAARDAAVLPEKEQADG